LTRPKELEREKNGRGGKELSLEEERERQLTCYQSSLRSLLVGSSQLTAARWWKTAFEKSHNQRIRSQLGKIIVRIYCAG